MYIAENFTKIDKIEKKKLISGLLSDLHNGADLILSPNQDIESELNSLFEENLFRGMETNTINMHTTKDNQEFMIYHSIFQRKTGKIANVAIG